MPYPIHQNHDSNVQCPLPISSELVLELFDPNATLSISLIPSNPIILYDQVTPLLPLILSLALEFPTTIRSAFLHLLYSTSSSASPIPAITFFHLINRSPLQPPPSILLLKPLNGHSSPSKQEDRPNLTFPPLSPPLPHTQFPN